MREHPLWLVGFRPLFTLACISGATLPLLWLLIYSGKLSPQAWSYSVVQWHAHEMFYGFGWSVLGGFLLTSIKNWVHVRGYHGLTLVYLTSAWVLERIGMWWGGNWPPLMFYLSNILFLASIVVMLSWMLVRHRGQDAFRDNYFFLIVLPAFLVAKVLILIPAQFQFGASMTLALFRIAFLLMLERTLTQFMKAMFQVEILRNPRLDNSIKIAAVLLIPAAWYPTPLMVGLALFLAALLSIRLAYWHPLKAMQRIDIGVMYLGYCVLILQLLAMSLQALFPPIWEGALPTHLFTFGVMGLIIPAMLIRIIKGHTGRKVEFDGADKWVLRLMMLATTLRIVMSQVVSGNYLLWVSLAALAWSISFGILAWRYIPYLMQARMDGREH